MPSQPLSFDFGISSTLPRTDPSPEKAIHQQQIFLNKRKNKIQNKIRTTDGKEDQKKGQNFQELYPLPCSFPTLLLALKY